MADSDGKLPSEEQQEQDIEKVPVVLKFKDNTYHCKLCRNNTQSRNAFEEHVAAHCLLKPYICIQCNTSFRLKTEMDKHVKKVHENKKVRCGVRGMKKVEEHMNHLLKQGDVKFKGFPMKKLDGCSADSAEVGSKGKSSVNKDAKTGDKKENTQKSTQESDNPSKSAESSENVVREDDNDKSKADDERVTGESVDGSEGKATQDRKPQDTTANISKISDQSLDEKNVSKHTVGGNLMSVGSSAGDIDKNSTHQSKMQANVSTCELGEGTSASTPKTGDTSNITSVENHNTQSSQLGFLSQNKSTKTSESKCDGEDKRLDLDSDDKSSDPLHSTPGHEESLSAKSKLSSFSADKITQKTVESEPVSVKHFQINSKHDNSECDSSNVTKRCSDLSGSSSSENVSLISEESSNVSSAQFKPGSSSYETQGSGDAKSHVSSSVTSTNAKCAETSEGRENSSATGNAQDLDFKKQQKVVESLPEGLEVKSHLHHQITRVTPHESNMAANVLTESETSTNLLPQPSDLSKFQSTAQSKSQMASGPNTHSSITSAEKVLVMKKPEDKISGKDEKVYLQSSNCSLTEISVPPKESSASTTKKSDCVQPMSQEENLHVQEEVLDVSGMLMKDNNKETERTNYVKDMNEISSDTKTDEQVRSPVSGPSQEKGQQLAAATDQDAPEKHMKQDEANKDLQLRQDGQFTAATDKSLPQFQGIISAAAQDHLLLPTAAIDKEPTGDKVGHLMTTVDGVSQQGQLDQSTVGTGKDSPQSPGNQLNTLTDKDGGYNQGRLLTSTTDNGTPQVEGRKDISSADESSLHGKEVASPIDKDPQQEKETSINSKTDKVTPINQWRQLIDANDTSYPPEQQEQHTTARDTDSLLTKQHQSISTIDTDLTQNQVIYPSEEADRNPLHDQGRSLTSKTDKDNLQMEERQLSSTTAKDSLQNQGKLLTTAAGTCLIQNQGQQIIAVTDEDRPHDQGSVLTSTIDKDSTLAEEKQLGPAAGEDSSVDQGRSPTTTIDRNLTSLESSYEKEERDEQSVKDTVHSSEVNMIAAPSENVTEESDTSTREDADKQELKEKDQTNPSHTQPLTSTKPSGANDSCSDEDFQLNPSQESYSEMLKISDENEWIVKSNLSSLSYSGTHAAHYKSSDGKSSLELESTAGEHPSVGKQLSDSSDQSSTKAVLSSLKEKGDSSPKFKTMLGRNVYQQPASADKHPDSRQGTSDNPQQITEKRTTQENNIEHEKLLAEQVKQVQDGNQIQVQGPSVMAQQKPRAQNGNQTQARTQSPAPQQSQVQSVNQTQARTQSPAPQQTQVQSVNQPLVRGLSPVSTQQQRQAQVENQPLVRGPSPVFVNQTQARTPSPVPQQHRQDGNSAVVRGPSPVYSQQQAQAVGKKAVGDVNDIVFQEHEKIMAARMSIFNLTQPQQRIGNTSTAPNNNSVNNLNMLQTNNPSPQLVSCQVVGTPMASNQIHQMNQQSRASLPSPRQPAGQFMAIVPQTSMAAGIRVRPLNTTQQVRFQGNTNIQQSGIPGQLSSFPQVLGVAPAGFPNSNLTIQPNILQMQQQALLPQSNMVPGVSQGQTTLVHQQVPGLIGRMPAGMLITSPNPGFVPSYILSQDGTLRSTQYVNSIQTQAQGGNQTQVQGPSPVSLQQQTQAQGGNQTQVQGPSPVSLQQQTQTQGGNQTQVQGPSPVSLQQQTQTQVGNQTQVRGPSPVSVQSKEPVKPVGKISKLTSLKATTKIAELFRKSRGDKQLQNTELPRAAESAVSETQTSSAQPDTETVTVKRNTGNVTEQPVSAIKKKSKGNFRKVGPDYLCIHCKIETQSEKAFCRHIWTHFHITRNLCTGCPSSAENTSKCQLVMSVIDGLKYGCSVGSSDAEPIQIKTEPEDDDDVVLVKHIPPPKKARFSFTIKQEATQTAFSKNTDVSVTRERETTFQKMASSGITIESNRQETTSGVYSTDDEQRNETTQKECQKESGGTRFSLADGTAGTSEFAARGKSCDVVAEVMEDNSSIVTTSTTNTPSTFDKDKDRVSASKLVVSESGRKLIYQFIAQKNKAKQTKSNTAESENIRTYQSVPTTERTVTRESIENIRTNQSVPTTESTVRSESSEKLINKSIPEENQGKQTESTESENIGINQFVAQSAEVDPSPRPLERTTGNFYVCDGFDSCQFSCLTIADFYKHMSTVHNKAMSFLCVHCGYRCPSTQLLIRHLHSHLKNTAIFFPCCISGCRFQTNLLHDYSSHLGTVHSRCNTFSCTFCDTSFTSVALLLQHIQENTLKFVRCPHCKVADTDVKLVKQHLASTHPSKSRHMMVACELVCKERLKNNFQDRTVINKSSHSPSAGNDKNVMEVPQQADTTGQTLECLSDTCDEEEVQATENQQATKAVNTRPTLSLKMHETVISEISACDSTVSPTPSLSHLDGSATEEDPLSSDVDSTVSTRLQKCRQCSFTSKGKISMTSHEKIHAKKCRDEKVFACPLCPDGMATIQLFCDHMKSHIGNHTVTMYYCDLCQIVTNKRETILTHGKQFHSEFNENTDISTRDMKFSFWGYACDKCDYCTTSQLVYDKHVETHVEEIRPTRKMSVDQKCPYCIYHTQDEVTFNLHITNMHQKQLNKEKRNRKSSLERDNSKHLKSVLNESESENSSSPTIHSSENFQDKTSSSSAAMEQSHDQNDLSEKSTSMISQERVSQLQSDDSYQSQVAKRYRCCECTKGFSSANQLKIHLEFHWKISKKNYEIKLWRCSLCDYSTTERLWLERHNREQHKNSAKLMKQRREVIHVGEGTTETSNTSQKAIQPAVDKKAFLIPVQSTFPQPVTCSECSFFTRDRASLVIHVTNHATLYPSFEDPTDSTEENEKEDSVTVEVERIDDTNNVDKNSEKSDSKNLSLDTPFSLQTGDLTSDDSEQDVIDLLTDESTDEYEKDETQSEKDRGLQLAKNKSTAPKKVATSSHKSSSTSDKVTGNTPKEEMVEAASLRPQRKSQDCDSMFRLGGDQLHVKLKPCFSQGKDNMFSCELCGNGSFRDKYKFHKHLLRHMNLWFYMCGYCDFHCFEQSAMTSHLTKLHKNRPYQILKMEVEDFRNRINEIIHCRKAGVSMSSLINTNPQQSSKNRGKEDIKDERGHTSNSKEEPDSASKSKPQNTPNVETLKAVGKSSLEKDSVLRSEKSLNSQKTSGIGKVTTVGAFHKCSVCGFKSKDKDAVVRHLGVHSQGNKHHCQHCPFQTSVAGDLRLHMTKRHPETCKEKPRKSTCSRELKELLNDQNSRSAPKNLSPNQSDNRTSSTRNQSTGKIRSSALENSTNSKTSVSKKNMPVPKTPKVSKSLSPVQQKGGVKTVFRHNLKKSKDLYRCNICRYCSKWGSNMTRHMQCMHNVKVIPRGITSTSSNKKGNDAESEGDDAESSNAESDDIESSNAESDNTVSGDAESDDTESGDVESDDTVSGDAESDDTESSDAESDDTESGDAESDEEESDNTQDGKKGQRKPVLYTCDIKVNAVGHYQCPLCVAVLQFKSNMYRHGIEVHKADIKEGYTCLLCKKDFRLKTPFLNHFRTEKCDKPWFLCTLRHCKVVCLDRQKSIKHMQKEHSVTKKPILLNTRKMKIEKCLIKGNLLHRLNKKGRPASQKQEEENSEKEEKSPSKKNEKPPTKKDKSAPSNLCYTKSPEMKDVHCGSCGQERHSCFAYQLHCNNKHSEQALCCFFCKKFTTISIRHMIFHTIDVHKEKVLKFYHVPKKEEHIMIAYKFKITSKGKKANLNKSILTTNRFFDSTRKVKSSEELNFSGSDKQKNKSNLERQKQILQKQTSSVSSCEGKNNGNYRCMAVKGCGFVSPKYDSLRIHIQRHLNYKPYKCEICGLQFFMEQYAKMHHTKVHYHDNTSITVERTAATEEKIATLLRKGDPHYFVNKKFTADDVRKLRNGPKRLYKEIEGKTASWKCVECDFEAKSRKRISDHVYKHLPKIYKCPFCMHTGYPRYTVVNHISEVHPTENKATPVINLLDNIWRKTPKASSSGSSSASNTSSESSDTDVYSGDEEENLPRAKGVTAKSSGIPDQILESSESSDSDIPQSKLTPKTKTATQRKRARISSDSDDENEAVERKSKLQKQNRPTSKSAETQCLGSSSDSDEETEESEEEEESSTSVQDTDESSSSSDDDEEEEEEVTVPNRRKHLRPLSDSLSEEIDYGPTRYFCHQCCFRSEDLKVYCRHLVTHGGYNQLCPHRLSEKLRKSVEEELEQRVDGTSQKEGTTFCCAYCSFMAVTSFRVKQHITTQHPGNYTDYMEIHTKYNSSEVMEVAIQPSIIMTDICKMDLMDLAMMLAHEGVRMNSSKKHEVQDEGSETGATFASSSGEKKRKKFSIMSPSKYYKKSGSHTDVHQTDVLTDDKGNETGQRTEEMMDVEEGPSSSNHDLSSEETENPRNIFSALVKLTQVDRNVNRGFETVLAEYLLAEEKKDTVSSRIVNVNDNEKLEVPESSEAGKDSLGSEKSTSESKVESTKSLSLSSTVEESLPKIENNSLEIENNFLTTEGNSLESQENSFETKTTDMYEDISECSDGSEGQSDCLGGHQTSMDVRDKSQTIMDAGLTTVSSTTDSVDVADAYSDISDCSDSILSKDDNLCEELPKTSEVPKPTRDNVCQATSYPSSTNSRKSCDMEISSELPNTSNLHISQSHVVMDQSQEISSATQTQSPYPLSSSDCVGGDMKSHSECVSTKSDVDSRLTEDTQGKVNVDSANTGERMSVTAKGNSSKQPVVLSETDQTSKGDNSVQPVVLSETAQTTKGSNSLSSDITGDNVMSSIDSMLDSLSDIGQTQVAESTVKHSADNEKSVKHITDQEIPNNSGDMPSPESQDSDNESCHSIGFEVKTESQEL